MAAAITHCLDRFQGPQFSRIQEITVVVVPQSGERWDEIGVREREGVFLPSSSLARGSVPRVCSKSFENVAPLVRFGFY